LAILNFLYLPKKCKKKQNQFKVFTDWCGQSEIGYVFQMVSHIQCVGV